MTSDETESQTGGRIDGLLLLVVFFLLFKLFFVPWITGDGLSYFAYLRSLVVDGDLDFRNEFNHVLQWNTGKIHCGGKETATGHVGNCFPIGPAVLWSPVYTPVYLLQGSVFSREANAGYGKNEIFAVCFATLAYSLSGIFIMYELLKRLTSKFSAFCATLTCWLATPLVYYMYQEPSMAHGLSFFTSTLFLYAWLARREKTWLNTIILGVLGGVMTLVRWQDALFLAAPLLENAVSAKKEMTEGRTAAAKEHAAKTLALLTTVLLVFSPQLISWQIIYGSPNTALEDRHETFDWTRPHIPEALLSPNHGLLSWTPAYILAIIGLHLFYRRKKDVAAYILLPLILQFLLTSLLPAWHWDWSFGSRGMVSSTPIFAIGTAFLIQSAKGWIKAIIILLLLAAVAWNLLLLVQVSYSHWLIDPNIPYKQLADNQLTKAPELAKKLVEEKFFSGR